MLKAFYFIVEMCSCMCCWRRSFAVHLPTLYEWSTSQSGKRPCNEKMVMGPRTAAGDIMRENVYQRV